MTEQQKNETLEKLQRMKLIIATMKQESETLVSAFWSPEEQIDLTNTAAGFRARMNTWADTIEKNLDWYQSEGWKKLK